MFFIPEGSLKNIKYYLELLIAASICIVTKIKDYERVSFKKMIAALNLKITFTLYDDKKKRAVSIDSIVEIGTFFRLKQ
jgi:hypothetical protein